ncbi:MAG: DNA-protecting protein DprA, partial [Bacteroides acidifaciens]|nr:DNA-protecting protein DprA [Bacteroides acidifaciens]
MKQQFLSKEDILCMQYAGMRAHQIMHSKFEKEEYAEAFETYIDKAESIMEIQHEYGVVTLTFQDEDFPCSLTKIGDDCPPMIHCLGDLSLLAPTDKRIAVIGARAASPAGNRKAYELGRKFAEEGNIIVSGLALGCDKAAHEGCLYAGGKTIAIVASGLNIVHPKENEPLQQHILENGGLILSEQPFGMKANPTRLVARNRLQAAL